MFDAISPSDAEAAGDRAPRSPRWSDGAAEAAFEVRAGESRLAHLYQSDPCRILFPRVATGAPPEAVIVTTSGGIVGGDRLRFALSAGPDSAVTYTTQAAEKVYRSAGQDSEIDIHVRAGDGAFLEWMPQETILFDGARLRRRSHVEISGSARVLTGEIIVFGRRARGEVFSRGLIHDAWRIYRDGTLAWADALHLDGETADDFANPHAFAGASAMAMLIYAGPDAEERHPEMRDLLGDAPGAAATRIGDLVVARFLDADAAALRRRFATLWKNFRHAATGYPARLPRVWDV